MISIMQIMFIGHAAGRWISSLKNRTSNDAPRNAVSMKNQ